MSDFSFNGTAGASQSTDSSLPYGDIYEVTFDGCAITEGQYGPVFEIKFKSPQGVLNHKIFEPKRDDKNDSFARRRGETNGKAWAFPSAVEGHQLLFKHLLDEIAPEFAKRIDNGEKMEFKTWNDLCKIVIKETTPFIGTVTNIKVMPNYKGFSELGVAYNIGSDDKARISSNGIGKKLAFSAYEIKQIEKARNAAKIAKQAVPTAKEEFALFTPATETDTSDLDLSFNTSEL